MLSIKSAEGIFNLRAAAVIREKGNLLLLNEPLAGPFWILPGGRAEMHESTDMALAREIEEEMRASAKVGRLLWVAETFFPHPMDKIPIHMVCFYYSVELPSDHPLCSQKEYFTARDEDGQHKQFHFRWCSLEEVLSMDVQPSFVKNAFPTIDDTPHVRHYVVRE